MRSMSPVVLIHGGFWLFVLRRAPVGGQWLQAKIEASGARGRQLDRVIS